MLQLTAPGKGTPDEAVKQFVGQEGVKTGQVSSAPVNGLPAASTQFEAQTEQGAVQGVVAFIKYGGSHLPAARLHAGRQAPGLRQDIPLEHRQLLRAEGQGAAGRPAL